MKMKIMNTETSGGDLGRVRRQFEMRFGPLESSRREEDNHGGGEVMKRSEENEKSMITTKKKGHVAVVSEHVKYESFVVQSDVDLEVIFHSQRNFLEVRTTKLYVKLENIVASSSGSNLNPTSIHIGGYSSAGPIVPVVPVILPCVTSLSFAADLHHENDDGCDLGDNRTFGEVGHGSGQQSTQRILGSTYKRPIRG
ncbi:hypothetical protein PIB30_035205 [Stylosanthes scabra]|uniref:Uncharacterized protein n=1 Tax=Stylosanthes scabra TaxID=79078 RepID=A0ABU6RDA2_9FABA|nr:hypothetical protein [Stylosanthes scabra]